MELRLIDVKSLVGIANVPLNEPLVRSIVLLRSNAKPVIVVKDTWCDDLCDFTYRVVGNNDVAVAAREAYRLGEMEMVNAVITTDEQTPIIKMQF